MTAFLCALGAYLIAISLLAIFLTIHDKQRALSSMSGEFPNGR